MKFHYKKFILEKPTRLGRVLLRPILPVQIERNGKKIGYEALVDSGADFCIFHAVIGEIIGIDIKEGITWEFGGITGGKSIAYFHKIKISVGGWPHEITAGFSYDLPPSGFGVLGQIGFFDKFIIKFDFQKEIFELKPKLYSG